MSRNLFVAILLFNVLRNVFCLIREPETEGKKLLCLSPESEILPCDFSTKRMCFAPFSGNVKPCENFKAIEIAASICMKDKSSIVMLCDSYALPIYMKELCFPSHLPAIPEIHHEDFDGNILSNINLCDDPELFVCVVDKTLKRCKPHYTFEEDTPLDSFTTDPNKSPPITEINETSNNTPMELNIEIETTNVNEETSELNADKLEMLKLGSDDDDEIVDSTDFGLMKNRTKMIFRKPLAEHHRDESSSKKDSKYMNYRSPKHGTKIQKYSHATYRNPSKQSTWRNKHGSFLRFRARDPILLDQFKRSKLKHRSRTSSLSESEDFNGKSPEKEAMPMLIVNKAKHFPKIHEVVRFTTEPSALVNGNQTATSPLVSPLVNGNQVVSSSLVNGNQTGESPLVNGNQVMSSSLVNGNRTVMEESTEMKISTNNSGTIGKSTIKPTVGLQIIENPLKRGGKSAPHEYRSADNRERKRAHKPKKNEMNKYFYVLKCNDCEIDHKIKVDGDHDEVLPEVETFTFESKI